jgi:hypothetical protein
MMLQKLALLWMLEDQEGKLNWRGKRKSKMKGKERKIPSGPEVWKPHQKLMEQSPLPFTVRIRICRCFGYLAVTYAEKKISDENSRRKSSCWRSWSAVIPQINRRNLKNPLKKI